MSGREQCLKQLVLLGVCLLLPGCSRTAPVARAASVPAATVVASTAGPERRVIRSTGLTLAQEWKFIRSPQLAGTGRQVTITRLVPNGARVKKGDLLVEFDRTQTLDEERDAKSSLGDFAHQLDEKRAQVKSEAAKRTSQLRDAEADLEKAELQLRKGPVLSDIDRLKNEAKAANARLRVESLKKSAAFRDRSEAAAVKILELKLERQQLTLDRAQSNLDRLLIRAPHDGMVAHENTWRQGSMGPPQVGDQMWPGLPLLRIFNPTNMVVQATIDEPDFAQMSKATHARVYLDAYPGVTFDAVLESASPVAVSGIDSPVRNFIATFRIDQQSPNLLPDLSAALEIDTVPARASAQPVPKATP